MRHPHPPSDPDVFRLIMTVARILRAKIRDEIYAEQEGDLAAMNEALAPFDPVPQEPVDEKNT